MADVEIRDASDDDLPAILRILAESGIDGGESFTLEEARDHFARIRQRPGFRLLVAVVDGDTVGTYTLLIMEKLGKRGTLRGRAPSWRGRCPALAATAAPPHPPPRPRSVPPRGVLQAGAFQQFAPRRRSPLLRFAGIRASRLQLRDARI